MENKNDTTDVLISDWWENNYVRLKNYANKIIRDNESVNDIIQQVALATIINKSLFNSEEHFIRWAYQKIRWFSLDLFRKRDKDNILFDYNADLTKLSTKPIQEKHQLVSTLFDEIQKLPTRQKEVAERYYIKNQDNDRIAEELGIDNATVRSFLRHSRSILAERLWKD